jgi:hypothetical protein
LISLFDGVGASSYPFAYTSTVIIGAEGNSTDCSLSQELTQFISWIHTNQRVSDRVSTQGWSPLTVAYRKKIIDVLGTIECDNDKALTTAYLIGEGTSRPALSDLAGQYTSNTVTQKYFTSDMATAIVDMKQGSSPPFSFLLFFQSYRAFDLPCRVPSIARSDRLRCCHHWRYGRTAGGN